MLAEGHCRVTRDVLHGGDPVLVGVEESVVHGDCCDRVWHGVRLLVQECSLREIASVDDE